VYSAPGWPVKRGERNATLDIFRSPDPIPAVKLAVPPIVKACEAAKLASTVASRVHGDVVLKVSAGARAAAKAGTGKVEIFADIWFEESSTLVCVLEYAWKSEGTGLTRHFKLSPA